MSGRSPTPPSTTPSALNHIHPIALSGSHDRRRDSERRSARRLLWWSGWALILITPLLFVFTIGTPILTVQTIVIPTALGPLLLLAGAACCWVVCFFLWLAQDGVTRRTAWQKSGSVAAAIATVPGLLALVALALVYSMGMANYQVLSPRSPGGCRIVLETGSFLGQGNVYLEVPGSLTPQRTQASWEEDGRHPLSSSLSWDGNAANLKADDNRLENENGPIRCPR